MSAPITIVLTGGPCAGKSTVTEALRDQLAGEATFMPEVATLLLEGGFPLVGRELSFSPAWRDSFQRAIAQLQVEMEEAHRLAASEHGHRLLILDRGALDGVAYMDDAAHWAEVTGLDPTATLRRYDHVIHLTSLAVSRPELYGKGGNEHRRESVEEAADLCHQTRQAWAAHHSHHLIENGDTVTELVAKVTNIVCTIKEAT